MYCGCLMMFVSFIRQVIQHCNFFSPQVLNSSLWTLTGDCSPPPSPSCLADFSRSWMLWQIVWEPCFQMGSTVKIGSVCHWAILLLCPTALGTYRIFASYKIPKQARPELQQNAYRQLLLFTKPWPYLCKALCHKTYSIKSKSMLESVSHTLWWPGLGLLWWQWGTCCDYLRASRGLSHLSVEWNNTFILIGRNFGTMMLLLCLILSFPL